MQARLQAVALGACALVASSVQAHAPQTRALALARDGAAIAIAMPGFGILLRPAPTQPFAYLCDAALGLEPADVAPQLAFVADGSLLVGTRQALRRVAPDGCPAEPAVGGLSAASIVALAAQPGTDVVYAATGGDVPGLWRSVDGGRAWQKRSALANAELVSALHIHADDVDSIYLSIEALTGSSLLVSTDAGASFTSFEHDRGLRLLAVQGGASKRLWAVARSADNTSNRGFDVLRADAPLGPWSFAVRVSYFGGFAIDAAGRIWVGDEAGGAHRSDDGGTTFVDTAPEQALACLASAGDVLWACAPGLPQEPALITQTAGAAVFTPALALAQVDTLVQCSDELDVPTRCAAAWVEWRRDVRLEDLAGDASTAGNDGDAGGAADAASDGDAGRDLPRSASPQRTGCTVSAGVGSAPGAAATPILLLGFGLLLAVRVAVRRRA